MKSHLRISKASGSTKRRVDAIIRQGKRFTRRRFVAAERTMLRDYLRGGLSRE
jgi:hypothetical protein